MTDLFEIQQTLASAKDVIFKPNGKRVGVIYQEVDGEWVYAFEGGGGFSTEHLHTFLAEQLRTLNQTGTYSFNGLQDRGPWISTRSGRHFYLLDPRPEDIDLEDIAHALANQCRYNGHTETFYSVAQHSVLLSLLVRPQDAILALMHDATEAYVGDVVRPLKALIPNYHDIEQRIWRCIVQTFPCIDYDEIGWAKVAEYDRRICMNEAAELLPFVGTSDWNIGEPLDDQDGTVSDTLRRPWNPHEAKARFLSRFKRLCNE